MIVVGAALSEHPLATHAVGEVVGGILDAGGPRPDLMAVFVTEPHLGVLEDITAAVRHLLGPRVLLGCSAASVLAGSREVEDRVALSAFAVWFGAVGVRAVRLGPGPGTGLSGSVEHLAGARGTLVVLADPFSVPLAPLLDHLSDIAPSLDVVGGAASSGRRPGGNRLVLDGAIHDAGAVAVHLGPDVPVRTVVSQGCRPVGAPFTVTRSERSIVRELGGRPALERLREVLDGLDEQERTLAGAGLRLGKVLDEQQDEFGRGDFLVADVLGADHGIGALSVSMEAPVGSTVQFHLRDAGSAHEDLVGVLAGRPAAGALCFSDVSRDAAFFGRHDHDAATVSDAVPAAAVAGAFLSGTVGPVGGRNAVHESALCILLVDPRAG